MRYRFVDDVISLRLGDTPSIEVTKVFEASDDAFSGPSGAHGVPNSLILELLATAGGHLIFRRLEGRRLPLLLKAPAVRFEGVARPGERLHALAELRGLSDARDDVMMAETIGEVREGTRQIATGRFLYACVEVPAVDLDAWGTGA